MKSDKTKIVPQKNKSISSVSSPDIDLNFPARISSQLFCYGKYRWNMAVRPFRLLMMVTQTLAKEKHPLPTLFPEYTFPLNKVFEYMGISNCGNRYDLIIDDMKELMSTVIDEKETTKKGKVRWTGKTLITNCYIDGETNQLCVQINENSREYLVGMQRWAELQPKIYLKLSTKLQNWFYAYFKKEVFIAKNTTKPIRIYAKINVLKEMLYLDEMKTYDPTQNKNANEKFFSRVLGITKPKGWKFNSEETLLNTPWDYVIGTDNNPTGTLYNITKNTDINAYAYPIKEGKAYTQICFIINRKKAYIDNNLIKGRNNQGSSQTSPVQILKPKANRGQTFTMKDMFSDEVVPVLDNINNPLFDDKLPSASHITVPQTLFNQFYEEYQQQRKQQISREEFARLHGWEIQESGEIVKNLDSHPQW